MVGTMKIGDANEFHDKSNKTIRRNKK